MNEIQIFSYNDREVRTVQKDGGTWWVLKDVCDVLGLSDTNKTADRLDVDELTRIKFVSGGQNREMLCINESGLYNVILRSDKPEAKNFKRWVTHEVLPSIRKHGAYMTAETLEAAILNPDTMIRLCTALKSEQDKRRELEVLNSELTVKNQIMQPKADYFDELVERNTLTNFRETAQQLKIGQTELINFLIRKKYIYRNKSGKLLPYAEKNKGLFEVKECFNEKTKWSGVQTYVTPKGRETFRLLIGG